MKIVCGTDFSVHATEAANESATLAVRSRSVLTLVHAVEPWQVEFLSETHVDWLRNKLRRKLVAVPLKTMSIWDIDRGEGIQDNETALEAQRNW